MNILAVSLIIASLGFSLSGATGADQRGDSTNAALALGTMWRVGKNGQLEPAPITPSEMWPGVWKEDTNGLRVEVLVVPSNSPNPLVLVSVGSRVINALGSFVAPPNAKLAKCELRDPHGGLVMPTGGPSVEGVFASTISSEDLPRYREKWRLFSGSSNGAGLKGLLRFTSNSPPDVLVRFQVGDVYRVREEGVYNLTVCPVIYAFGTNMAYLRRIDLPCVSAKLHLIPIER